MNARWIKGYENEYYCTREGDVFKAIPPKRMKCQITKHDCSLLLTKNGKRKRHSVARLIYETWQGSIPETYVVLHENGVVADNHINNLKAVTRTTSSRRVSTRVRGRAVELLDDKRRVIDSFGTIEAASKALFVSTTTIRRCCEGKSSTVNVRWEVKSNTKED